MAIIAAGDLSGLVGTVVNVLYVALGLGLVIFFHELGHFAVAKWCGVFVERFSIGFGPILWSFKRGDTEYALSAIPFGGYVKMLGQDDIDPSQLSSEQIAENPRSYSAKPVRHRMFIISAGVIMNIITGLMFFAIAFQLGVDSPPAEVGFVTSGSPAYEAGIETGDVFTHLNGEHISDFGEIMLGVALSSGDVQIRGLHRDQAPFDVTITPDQSGTRRIIGVKQPLGVRLVIPRDDTIRPTYPGMPADSADPPFEAGDMIQRVGDVEIETFAELQDVLASQRNETLEFLVRSPNGTDTRKIRVGTNRFRLLGLSMDIGPITEIVRDSPAATAGLQVNDKIITINGQDVGKHINPLRLPDLLSDLQSQKVVIEVLRQQKTGEPETLKIELVPEDRSGWLERPDKIETPLSAPAAGFAFLVIPRVLQVTPDSPAAKHGIEVGQSVTKVELVGVGGTPSDGAPNTIEIDFTADNHNWAYAFWMIQSFPERKVRLTVGSDPAAHVVEVAPDEMIFEDDWYLPTRGIRLDILMTERKADGLVNAFQMGVTHTKKNIIQIYLTLRSLVRGDVSPRELHGPVGIATVAYQVAEQGLAKLLLFLGFLSINLAVLNFLPIPVLDGGHMVFLTWEAITRKRPSERVLIAATYVGMAFVLSLMVFVLYLDIFVHWLGFN
ncbi:MAG: site-2 protease family protein [Planctomycetaceae bacterium]